MATETPIAFHSLTFITELDGVTVGRPDTATFVSLPHDGAELLRRLADGMGPSAAAEWYQSTFGESVDIDDFLDSLTELGFVRAPGEPPAAPVVVRHRALGRAMFSPLAWLVYLGVITFSIIAMIRDPELRPSPNHVFFLPSLVAVQIILILTQIPGLLIHEWFHVMAGRRRGLPTRLTVSRRLFFAVFETELNGLLGIPRRQRYLIFLAGMLADLLVITGLTLAATAAPDAWPARLALAIAYLTIARLAWQLLIFLRTDPYYVLTTALGCTNLAEASSAYLRGLLGRVTGRQVELDGDEQEWTSRDLRYTRAFATLTVLGTASLLVLAGFAAVPVLVEFADRIAAGLSGGTAGGPRFWDSTASLAALITQFGVLPLLAGRMSRAKTRQEDLSAQGASR